MTTKSFKEDALLAETAEQRAVLASRQAAWTARVEAARARIQEINAALVATLLADDRDGAVQAMNERAYLALIVEQDAAVRARLDDIQFDLNSEFAQLSRIKNFERPAFQAKLEKLRDHRTRNPTLIDQCRTFARHYDGDERQVDEILAETGDQECETY